MTMRRRHHQRTRHPRRTHPLSMRTLSAMPPVPSPRKITPITMNPPLLLLLLLYRPSPSPKRPRTSRRRKLCPSRCPPLRPSRRQRRRRPPGRHARSHRLATGHLHLQCAPLASARHVERTTSAACAVARRLRPPTWRLQRAATWKRRRIADPLWASCVAYLGSCGVVRCAGWCARSFTLPGLAGSV